MPPPRFVCIEAEVEDDDDASTDNDEQMLVNNSQDMRDMEGWIVDDDDDDASTDNDDQMTVVSEDLGQDPGQDPGQDSDADIVMWSTICSYVRGASVERYTLAQCHGLLERMSNCWCAPFESGEVRSFGDTEALIARIFGWRLPLIDNVTVDDAAHAFHQIRDRLTRFPTYVQDCSLPAGGIDITDFDAPDTMAWQQINNLLKRLCRRVSDLHRWMTMGYTALTDMQDIQDIAVLPIVPSHRSSSSTMPLHPLLDYGMYKVESVAEQGNASSNGRNTDISSELDNIIPELRGTPQTTSVSRMADGITDGKRETEFYEYYFTILIHLYQNGIVKRKTGEAMRPVFIDNGRVFTGAFEPTRERGCMRALIHQSYNSVENTKLFGMARLGCSNWEESVIKLCKERHDPRLPIVTPSRSIWSFKDGVFDAERMVYKPYGHVQFSASNLPCKFHNNAFKPGWDVFEKYKNNNKTETIEDHIEMMCEMRCPALDKCILFQLGYEHDDISRISPEHKEVVFWINVFLGRMLYDRSKHDSWDMLLYCFGVAGTGKSSLLEMLARIYPAMDIGTFGSNSERVFGLEAIVESYMMLATELNGDAGFGQSTLMQLVTDNVSVPRKNHRQANNVRPRGHVGIAGNVWIQQHNDDQGQMSRRTFLILFGNKIPPELLMDKKTFTDSLDADIPMFIMRGCALYRFAAGVLTANCHVSALLPEYFKESVTRAMTESTALYKFVKQSGQVELGSGDDFQVSEHMFVTAFTDYCRAQGINTSRVQNEMKKNIIEALGAKRELKQRPNTFRDPDGQDDEQREMQMYIVGLRLVSPT